jgi:16S rRNA (guanine966-N2)-methyltransferase
MRIIAGIHRGRRLVAPKGMDIRPTADRVKQYVFDIISEVVTNASVLDLFSGTGNLGFEALSRGASHVIFVENNRNATAIIKRNAELLRMENCTEVLQYDVINYLNHSHRSDEKFDLIFADPPYEYDRYDELISVVAKTDRLHPGGFFIIEHRSVQQFNNVYPGLTVERVRKLGNTSITRFSIDDKIK